LRVWSARKRQPHLLVGLCTAILIRLLAGTVAADEPDPAATETDTAPSPAGTEASIPPWQLRAGQTFKMSSKIRRQTTIHSGPTVRQTDDTDRIQLQYRVFSLTGDGAVRVAVRVMKMERTTRQQDGTESTVTVPPQNVLSSLDAALLVRDQGTHVGWEISGPVLRANQDAAGRNTIPGFDAESWLGLLSTPFRIPVLVPAPGPLPKIRPQNAEPAENDPKSEESADSPTLAGITVEQSWNRLHRCSLGILGHLNTPLHHTVAGIDSLTAHVEVTGTPTLSANTTAADQYNSVLKPDNLTLASATATGSGTITMAKDALHPKSADFEQTLSFSGTGELTTGRVKHQIRFEQSLTETWKVTEFEQITRPVIPRRNLRVQ